MPNCAHMRFLMLILSAVMTWTVDSKSAVSGSGDYPSSMQVTYSCSYQKGTVRKNDEAVLKMSNMLGMKLEKVDVYMRSNKDAGAGVITVKVNGQTVMTKSGSFKDWTGAYDNTAFHPISVLPKAYSNVNELSVSVKGTENSLYIEKYVIRYEKAAPRQVRLMNGPDEVTVLTEEKAGDGVLLPNMPDTAYWRFAGWSEGEFWVVETQPELYSPGRYFPTQDGVLWAAYRYAPDPEDEYVTDLQSGVYLYVNSQPETWVALAGTPYEGIIDYAPINPTDKNQWYQVDFTDNGTAFITHVLTGEPIGYSGTQMSNTHSEWQVYHEGAETIFYAIINNKTYVLWLNIYDTVIRDYIAGLFQATPANSPMRLQMVREKEEVIYTCHPESSVGIQNVPTEEITDDYIIPIGIYKLHIRNGQKYIRL